MVVGVTSSSAATAAAITLTSSVTRSLVTLRRHVTALRRPSLQNNNRIVSLTTAAAAVLDSDATSSPTEEEVREWAGMLDIRVGRVVRAWKHPQADSLYVEEVDIGHDTSPTPTQQQQDSGDGDGDRRSSSGSFRLICSGLVNFLPLPLLQDRKVVVLANLKPRNMRGVKSYGMLMAASDSSHEYVELLEPPESSLPGDRIWFGDDVDINEENLPDPASPNQIQKKKIWELVQPHLKTNASCVAVLGDAVMRTSAGVVRCRSLKDANVS